MCRLENMGGLVLDKVVQVIEGQPFDPSVIHAANKIRTVVR
jgi:hypothetical protein